MPAATRWVATAFGGPEVLEERVVSLAEPGPGQVLIGVRACGMNPADHKHFAPGQDPALLPLTVGYELAGIVLALGPDTELASGGGRVGDAVVAFQVADGYSTVVLAPAADVFAKPSRLSFAEAANVLLVGTTAAEMLARARVVEDDTVLVHGASGAVGTSVVQQARVLGARVLGTARPDNFEIVRRYGGIPVAYGPGLEERVRASAPQGISAALDTVGTDEAVDVSRALLGDPARLVSIAAFGRSADGVVLLGAGNPASGPFRAAARAAVLAAADAGDLVVPLAASYPFAQAPDAVRVLQSRHASGKLALVVDAPA